MNEFCFSLPFAPTHQISSGAQRIEVPLLTGAPKAVHRQTTLKPSTDAFKGANTPRHGGSFADCCLNLVLSMILFSFARATRGTPSLCKSLFQLLSPSSDGSYPMWCRGSTIHTWLPASASDTHTVHGHHSQAALYHYADRANQVRRLPVNVACTAMFFQEPVQQRASLRFGMLHARNDNWFRCRSAMKTPMSFRRTESGTSWRDTTDALGKRVCFNPMPKTC